MIVLLYLLDTVYHIIHIFIHQSLPDALLRLSISSPNVHCCHRAKIMFLANLLQMFWMTDGVMIGGLLINCPTAAMIAVRGLACFAKGVNFFRRTQYSETGSPVIGTPAKIFIDG